MGIAHVLDCINLSTNLAVNKTFRSRFLTQESDDRVIRHTRESIPYMPELQHHDINLTYPQDMFDVIEESLCHKTDGVSSIMHHAFRVAIESGIPALAWWMVKKKIDRRYNEEEVECTICYDEKVDIAVLECGHEFCLECVNMWRQTHSTCPICKQRSGPPIRLEDLWNNNNDTGEIPKFNFENPKTVWLRQLVSNTQHQIIVFCERSDVCIFLKTHFSDSEILTGVSTQKKKEAISRDFRSNKFKILFTTLRTAAVGINLQVAKHAVFWTMFSRPRSVEQACARLCRLGATHSVVTCHFLRLIH